MTSAEPPVRVLALIDFYLPGYRGGGPVKSLYNMVEQLAPEIRFDIVTQNHDLGESAPYAGLPSGEWVSLDEGRSRVFYLPSDVNRLKAFRQIAQTTEHDVVYLSSFFSPVTTLPFLLLRLLRLIPRRPVVLAVRGEFSPAALGLKRLKKAAYLQVARRSGLLRHVLFQATSGDEAADIRRVLGDSTQIVVAGNLPTAPASEPERTPYSGPLRVVFLSRVVPMKNLDFALDVLKNVSQPLRFTIYGPLEDEAYWQVCQQKLRELPPHIQAEYKGSVPPQEVTATLREHDFFFLPTRGENFGHAIVEALAAGCPVLISDRTPWKGLESYGCGWDLPLSEPQAFAQRLDTLALTSRQDLRALSQQAVGYAKKISNNQALIDQTRRIFTWNRI